MSVTSNILAINMGNLKLGGVSVRAVCYGRVWEGRAQRQEEMGTAPSARDTRRRKGGRGWLGRVSFSITCIEFGPAEANARALPLWWLCGPGRGGQDASVSF